MTDPVIPPEAVEAVARQVFFAKHGLDWDFVWFAEEKRAKARQDASEFALIGLLAALPHLRPLFEVATQVGLELGRQEALEDVRQGMSLGEDWQITDPRLNYVDVQVDKDLYREIQGDPDARTDPSGHTDLPPTPDALSTVCPRRPHERHADRG